MFDSILESLETPRTNANLDSMLKFQKTNQFLRNAKNNSISNIQNQILQNSFVGQGQGQRNLNRVPEQTPESNRHNNVLRSLDNMQMINSVTQAPQAKKKFICEDSGKPYSIDISMQKGPSMTSAIQKNKQYMDYNQMQQQRSKLKPPSFEQSEDSQFGKVRVFSPPKMMQQNKMMNKGKTRTMAGSPNRGNFNNNMHRNGGFSRAGGVSRMELAKKNALMNRPNMNSMVESFNQSQFKQQNNNTQFMQQQQQQQQFKQPSKPQGNPKKRGPSRPPIIREGDWLCSQPKCANINWAKRSNCHLCGSKRPHLSAVKKRPYMLTKLYEANTWSCPKCKNIIKVEHNYCCICGECRTQEILDGLRSVQRTIAYDRDGAALKEQEEKMQEDHECEEKEEFVNMEQMLQDVENDIDCEDENEIVYENNVMKNFGGMDYGQSSNKWYRNSEMSSKPF